jgi:hypothetical protein
MTIDIDTSSEVILTPTPTERLWANSARRPDGCREWTGLVRSDGYGEIRHAGVRVLAHRFAYVLLMGPIPAGLVLDHLCTNRACVNVSHLEPVSAGENVRRGGVIGERATHCRNGHPYEADMPPGRGRRCRTCHRLNEAARRRKAREAA